MTVATLTTDIAMTAVLQATTSMQFYRVKHWAEIGINLTSRPEVIVLDSNSCNFGQDWQWTSYWMNTTLNPLVASDLSKEHWTRTHDHQQAFHNKTGFLKPGDPRWNYVIGTPKNVPKPKWDKTRTSGGAILTGTESYSITQTLADAILIARTAIAAPKFLAPKFRESVNSLVSNNILQIEMMNGNGVAPTYDQMTDYLKKFWLYYHAVNVGSKVSVLRRFPQGQGQPVFIPLVASKFPVTYPLNKLQKLPLGWGYADWLKYDPYKIP